jgi:predicted DNA-binding protein (UPF0251 family)
MPRYRKRRRCRQIPTELVYKPTALPMAELNVIELELDEFESMRLCDLENKNQIDAAEIMGVSRATVQRLLTSGRKKVIDAMLNSKAIKIKSKI